MYLYIPPRWYYLVDILDGYIRFLVHWSGERTSGQKPSRRQGDRI